MKKIAVVAAVLVCFLAIASEARQRIVISSKSGNLNFRVSAGAGLAFGLGTEENGNPENIVNSSVFTARLGYSPWKYIEIQGESSQLGGFKKNSILPDQERSEILKFIACTVNLKILLPLKVKEFSFSPYVIGGYGEVLFMHDIAIKKFDSFGKQTDEYSTVYSHGICFKMGAGIDTFLSKNLFLFSEFSYWKSDLNIEFSDKTSMQLKPYYSVATIGIGSKF